MILTVRAVILIIIILFFIPYIVVLLSKLILLLLNKIESIIEKKLKKTTPFDSIDNISIEGEDQFVKKKAKICNFYNNLEKNISCDVIDTLHKRIEHLRSDISFRNELANEQASFIISFLISLVFYKTNECDISWITYILVFTALYFTASSFGKTWKINVSSRKKEYLAEYEITCAKKALEEYCDKKMKEIESQNESKG